MNQDSVWQIIRYALLLGGGYFAGRGIIPADQVGKTVDTIMNAIPGVVAAGTAIWGVWIKINTKSVPAATAARTDVPTVSPVTGQTQK